MTQHQAITIEDKDFFDYLKVFMYGESTRELMQAGKEIHSGVFYETMRMLEDVEFGLTKVKKNIISTQAAYLDSDDATQEDIIYFFNLLRLDKKLIEFAYKVDARFSIQVHLFIGLVEAEFSEFYDRSDWNKDNLPLSRIFECLAKYRDKYKLNQKARIDDVVNCETRHIGFVKLFDKIVKREKKVYVLNLAVKIIGLGSTEWDRNKIEHVMDALRFSYGAIVQSFNVLADFVNTSLGANESLNFHLVLILRNNRDYNEIQIADEIWILFNQYLNIKNNDYIVTVDSINEQIRYQFKQRHITGVLGYRPKKQLDDFNCWFLYLFTHSERFVSSERQKLRHLAFDIYEVGCRVPIILHEVRHPLRRPKPIITTAIVSLGSLYRDFNVDTVWGKAARTLNDKNEYVELCRIFDEQKHFFAFEKSTIELMAQLELFIVHLEQADISTIYIDDAQLEHIVQEPKRYLSVIEKLAIMLLLDHSLQTTTENLVNIQKGTLSPRLSFFCREHINNRNVVHLTTYEEFSLAFYKVLRKYLYDLKVKFNQNEIAAGTAQRTANAKKNFKSINDYLLFYFKQDADVYRFKMTCKFDQQDVPEALLSVAFSEIWTEFVNDIKRNPKVIGKQLVAHVGTYVALTLPLIDVTLIFESENKGVLDNDFVDNINKHWKSFLTDESKKRLTHKLEKRQQNGKLLKDPIAVDYIDFISRLSLDSNQLPLIGEKRKQQGKWLLCNYKDKKQRPRFIKALAEYYANYSFLKRTPIDGCEADINLLLKGRFPKQGVRNAIPPQILKTDTGLVQPIVEDNHITKNTHSQQDEQPANFGASVTEPESLLNNEDVLEQRQAESEDQPENIVLAQNIEHSPPCEQSDQGTTSEPVESNAVKIEKKTKL